MQIDPRTVERWRKEGDNLPPDVDAFIERGVEILKEEIAKEEKRKQDAAK